MARWTNPNICPASHDQMGWLKRMNCLPQEGAERSKSAPNHRAGRLSVFFYMNSGTEMLVYIQPGIIPRGT